MQCARIHFMPCFSSRARGLISLLAAMLLAGCNCGDDISASDLHAEITATSPIVADGTRSSLVTVRLLSADEPVAGSLVEVFTDRGDEDRIEQPQGPTDSEGVTTARISSSVPGTATITVTADGAHVEGEGQLVFVPDGECIPGEEEECYEGPPGTLDVGRCSAGVRTCTDEAEWGECEGQVLPAETDGIPCNGEDDNCDGTVDTHMDRSSPDSCGWCGNVCPEYPNAERLCDPDTGECSMGECLPGYYDLNEDPADGCEYACDGDPEADEVCDGTDTNCDGLIDGGPGGPFDVDGDGFTTCGTDFDSGGTDPALIDCDDLDPDVYPGAPGLCDGKDNDCDGEIDAPDEACDTGLVCEIGRCEVDECVTEPLDCSHLDTVCSVGACDEDAGGCVVDVDAREGETCEMMDGCTGVCMSGLCFGCECVDVDQCVDTGECGVASCVDQRCQYEPSDELCSSICADGSCDGDSLACVFDPEPFEGEECFLNGCEGICIDGSCDGCDCTVDEDCDDGVECTVSHCDGYVCVHQSDDALCDDGDVCTGQATCDPIEGCIEGEPLVCDDGDECTVNLCDPETGCYFPTRSADTGSAVIATASCLTAGAGGRAVVLVDLWDEAGLPLEGAALDMQVAGTSVAWVEPDVMESAASPGTYYRTLEAPSSGVSTTISVEATACGETVLLDQSVTIVYEEPLAGDVPETGGCDSREGNLRVRAIDEAGAPMADAFVMVGEAEDEEAFYGDMEAYLAADVPLGSNTTVTDSDGYAVFFDAGLALAEQGMLTVGADDRAYVSLVAVDSSDVVVELPITSPPTDEVEITGDVSGSGYPGSDDTVGMALVSRVLDLEFLVAFSIGNLFEDDVVATLDGEGFVGGECASTTLPIPGNVHLPPQTVVDMGWLGSCWVDEGVDPWTLRPYQSPLSTDLFALHGVGDPLDLADAETMTEMLSLVDFESVALLQNVPQDVSSSGRDLSLTHELTETMQTSIVDAPLGDCFLLAISDLDGLGGLGRLALQGMAMDEGVTDLDATLTTHDDEGIFSGKQDLAIGLSMEAGGGGFSLQLDRVTGGPDAPRTFDSMFGMPSTSVSGREMSWSGAIRSGVSPGGYELSRSVLRRDSPRGDWKISSEPFWIVYAPGDVETFTLPELPDWAPRAADGGFLVAGSGQTTRWSLSLIHLGLLTDPAGFDLGRHVLGGEVEWLTHVAGDLRDLP